MKLGLLRRIGPLGMALTVGQLAWTVRQHWHAVPADRRERLQELLRESRGRPSNLSKSQRGELRKLVRELNAPQLVRKAADVTLLHKRIHRPS
jgi:hypothetical protein